MFFSMITSILERHAYVNGQQMGRTLIASRCLTSQSPFRVNVVITKAWLSYAKSTEPIRVCTDYCRVAKAWYEGLSAATKDKEG
jgi:hypothetical protein